LNLIDFRVIGILPIKGPHNADNLSSLLRDALDSYFLDRKDCIHLFVRDGASAMIKTIQLLEEKPIHCFAHMVSFKIFI
jgi:hypothetical protein